MKNNENFEYFVIEEFLRKKNFTKTLEQFLEEKKEKNIEYLHQNISSSFNQNETILNQLIQKIDKNKNETDFNLLNINKVDNINNSIVNSNNNEHFDSEFSDLRKEIKKNINDVDNDDDNNNIQDSKIYSKNSNNDNNNVNDNDNNNNNDHVNDNDNNNNSDHVNNNNNNINSNFEKLSHLNNQNQIKSNNNNDNNNNHNDNNNNDNNNNGNNDNNNNINNNNNNDNNTNNNKVYNNIINENIVLTSKYKTKPSKNFAKFSEIFEKIEKDKNNYVSYIKDQQNEIITLLENLSKKLYKYNDNEKKNKEKISSVLSMILYLKYRKDYKLFIYKNLNEVNLNENCSKCGNKINNIIYSFKSNQNNINEQNINYNLCSKCLSEIINYVNSNLVNKYLPEYKSNNSQNKKEPSISVDFLELKDENNKIIKENEEYNLIYSCVKEEYKFNLTFKYLNCNKGDVKSLGLYKNDGSGFVRVEDFLKNFLLLQIHFHHFYIILNFLHHLYHNLYN